MKELEDRILELLKEAEDAETPSFGDENDAGEDAQTPEQDTNGGDSGNTEESPSFGDDSSDGDAPAEEKTEDSGSEDNASEGNAEDSEKTDDGKESNEEDEKEEKFTAKNFDDFLKQTKSRITIENYKDKEGKNVSEPSPMFGTNNIKNHNKYKIKISNEKGSIQFDFWDSVNNTEKGGKPTKEDVIACFGMDIGSVLDNISREQFDKDFGYDKTDDSTAQAAYDGCVKMLGKAKKIFDEDQIKELFRLAGEH